MVVKGGNGRTRVERNHDGSQCPGAVRVGAAVEQEMRVDGALLQDEVEEQGRDGKLDVVVGSVLAGGLNGQRGTRTAGSYAVEQLVLL